MNGLVCVFDENATIPARSKPRPHTHTACPACLLRHRHGQWLVWRFERDILWCPRCGFKITGQRWLETHR